MNQNSPVTTGTTALSGAMLGGIIVWACQAAKITPPGVEEAGAIGAVLLTLGHALVVRLSNGSTK